jgi:anti-anti-sigma regulatory factor
MVSMDGSTLRFNPSGELTIYQVEEALKGLLGSFGEAKAVFVDLNITDKIDTAGFQLLVSLTKSAKATGKECLIEGVGGSIENFAALFGYSFECSQKDTQ